MKQQSGQPWFPVIEPTKKEKPVPRLYPVINTDLARDNLETDIPAADLCDLTPKHP